MQKKRKGKKVNNKNQKYTLRSILRRINAGIMIAIIADGPTRFKKKNLKDSGIDNKCKNNE